MWLGLAVGISQWSSFAGAQVVEIAPPTPTIIGGQEMDSQGNSGLASLSTLPDAASVDGATNGMGFAINGDPGTPLNISDVIASVYSSFPQVQQSLLQRQVASGQALGAWGTYDTKLGGFTLSEPTGFYRNYRHGLSVARQTWWGGYLSAGYRIGRGDFQPWYKERETNEGGEFKIGWVLPLAQGRAIDPGRVAVFQANIARRAAGPEYQSALLQASQEASLAYWNWLAAGLRLHSQRDLVGLAQTRQRQFEAGEEAGKFAVIDVVFNRQLLAERTAQMLESQRKSQESGFKLSMFLRENSGNPLVPAPQWLPRSFPVIPRLPPVDFESDFAQAVAARPEMALLAFEIQRLQIDRRLACNQMMPTFDWVSEASQDAGVPASSINDKGQFELLLGFQGELPVQRRKARGKVIELDAKIAQVMQKRRLQRDKIGVELQIAQNDLRLADQILEQAIIGYKAAHDSLERYRYAFERGYADLIYLNVLETKATESEIKLIDAQRDWFAALIRIQAALGVDPLEQALNLSQLPASNRRSELDMPDGLNTVPEDFDADWQKHLQTNETGSNSAP